MNYAFMSFSCPAATFDEMLAMALHYGYDGIEPRTASRHSHGVELDASAEQRASFRARASDAGIAICCLAVGTRFADPASQDTQVAETLLSIDLAADIGAPVLRVFGGQIPTDVGRESAIDRLVDAFRRLAERADERGVIVCLETHDDWCNPQHVATVLERVNHPAIGVNWDVVHPLRKEGWSLEDSYQVLQPWIHHVHIHDISLAPDRLDYQAFGTGDVDHKRVLELLHSHRYEGYLSGEWINWEPPEVHLPREIATIRGYEQELVTLHPSLDVHSGPA